MKLNEIKPGDILIADGGFTCIHEGRECEVLSGESGSLYVMCCGEKPDFRDGDHSGSSNYQDKHFLNGQIDFDKPDEIVGFRRK